MAKISKDSLLHGLRGTIAKDYVCRELNGKTIFQQKPVFDKKKSSVAQKRTRSRFSEASTYAKKVTRDPLKKEYYKKKALELQLPNAYTAAIKEYLSKKEDSDTNS
jgi:hypothetical protein